MPIMTKKAKPVKVVEKPQPPVQSQPIEPKHTPIIKDATIPNESVLLYVEGSIWPVDYYSQILGSRSELKAQGVGNAPIYQQYTLIKRFELSVTSELSHSDEAEAGEFTTTGEATIYPAFVPNVGDMFLADIGDGRVGVFTLTTKTRLSIYKEACYTVEYQLVDYATETRLQDLANKVVNTYYYHREGVIGGGSAVITDKEYNRILSLKDCWQALKAAYWDEFYNVRLNSFTLYEDMKIIYDHYVVDFLSNTIPQDQLSPNEWITVLNCGQHYNNLRLSTLWRAISTRKPINFYSQLVKTAHLKNYREFHGDPSLAGIRFMGVTEVVYPNTELKAEKIEDQHKLNFPTVNLANSYYVLSPAFYQNDRTQCSLFERVLIDYLERKPTDIKSLIELCNKIDETDKPTRFYLMPMLMALVISNLSGGL